jgi:hypothetical protein
MPAAPPGTVFCCSINNGHNSCPPNSFIGGWWKADNSSFCGGAARYYIDCNAFKNGAWTCHCNNDPNTCDNRRVACNQFRYGQCNTQIPMSSSGPVVCRLVSCTPPWQQFAGTCSSSSRTDNQTAAHFAPCLAGNTPIGRLDSVTRDRDRVRLQGWALDRDQPGTALKIAVAYDAGALGVYNSTVPRPDVNSAYGVTGIHGFDITVVPAGGHRTIRLNALNVGAGVTDNPQIGSVTLDIPLDKVPVGRLDSVTTQANRLHLVGWTFDPDQPATSLDVDLYVDSTLAGRFHANLPRPDVNQAFGVTGAHGFDFQVDVRNGRRVLDLYALNAGPGTRNPVIAQRTVDVNPGAVPRGRVEGASLDGERVVLSGWAYDPDDPTAEIQVAVYQDTSTFLGWLPTGVPRPDVNRAFGIPGNHGFPGRGRQPARIAHLAAVRHQRGRWRLEPAARDHHRPGRRRRRDRAGRGGDRGRLHRPGPRLGLRPERDLDSDPGRGGGGRRRDHRLPDRDRPAGREHHLRHHRGARVRPVDHAGAGQAHGHRVRDRVGRARAGACRAGDGMTGLSTPTLTLTLAMVTAAVAAARGTWSPCGLSMVSAINPMSERARGNRYWLTCLWFVAGAVLGGLGLGLAGAALAAAASTAVAAAPHLVVALLAVGALICLAADTEVGGFRLPLLPRQVNERWLSDYRRWLYATGFGAQIGFGFATYVMTAATYLVLALMAATGSPGRAIAVGLVFGLVRGAAVTLSAGARDPHRLHQLHRRLDRRSAASLAEAMAAEVAVAVLLGSASAGWPGGLAMLLPAAVLLGLRVKPRVGLLVRLRAGLRVSPPGLRRIGPALNSLNAAVRGFRPRLR